MSHLSLHSMSLVLLALVLGSARNDPPLTFDIQIETVLQHDDGQFLWYHPRVAAYPGAGGPRALMTLQKHLRVSDYYSGTFVMTSADGGRKWSGPKEVPELAWREAAGGVKIAVADVTPGWHAPTRKILAVGAQVRYSPQGKQLDDEQRAHQTAYATFDPTTDKWTAWKRLELPPDAKFDFARSACAQWLVREDGTVLLPFYFGKNSKQPFSVTVVECAFDGTELKYQRHGTELTLPVVRGLCEPSLAKFQGRYYLTIRNDLKGYVTTSGDGMTFEPIRPWFFDDGAELGSYNTQQHWLSHSDGLFLVYTRRGANNDHIIRHRAPLFLAQVDPATLRVNRKSERVLIPERGGEMGNFGAASITPEESWVTVSEGVWSDDARKRGAKGATFVARVKWSRPNRDVERR